MKRHPRHASTVAATESSTPRKRYRTRSVTPSKLPFGSPSSSPSPAASSSQSPQSPCGQPATRSRLAMTLRSGTMPAPVQGGSLRKNRRQRSSSTLSDLPSPFVPVVHLSTAPDMQTLGHQTFCDMKAEDGLYDGDDLESPSKTAWSIPEELLVRLKQSLVDQLLGRTLPNPNQLVDLGRVADDLTRALRGTLVDGISQSAIVYGASGSGKSSLLRAVLHGVSETDMCLVQLNGHLHADERVCLSKVQRDLQSVLPSSVIPTGFSHAQAFIALFDYLRTAPAAHLDQDASRPVVFAIEELDVFLTQPRQLLLYNLFDLVQTGRRAVCVLGITRCMDVLERLEKRVKSRFTGLQYYVAPPSTVENYAAILAQNLTPDPSLGLSPAFRHRFMQRTQAMLHDGLIQKILAREYALSKKSLTLQHVFVEALARLKPQHPFLDVNQVAQLYTEHGRDPKEELLRGLTLLEFSLVIAMKRLRDHDVDTFNFAIRFATLHAMVFKRSVAKKAMERLLGLELVVPLDQVSKCPEEFRMLRLLVEPEQIRDSAMKSAILPVHIQRWARET